MDQSTIEAIKGSARKWKSIGEGIGIDAGRRNCTLCKKFSAIMCSFSAGVVYLCNDSDGFVCPIKKHTGAKGCVGTPYETWVSHRLLGHKKESHHGQAYCPECRRIALEFSRWILGLLPK